MKKSILALSFSLLFFLPSLFADEGSSAVEKESVTDSLQCWPSRQ